MKSILLVDDDLACRCALRLALKRAGYEVSEAGNGSEALERLQKADFDLMITDVIMPEKEGLETLVEAREQLPNLPVIVMSGGTWEIKPLINLRAASSLGANRVLQKPFHPEELLKAVRGVLHE